MRETAAKIKTGNWKSPFYVFLSPYSSFSRPLFLKTVHQTWAASVQTQLQTRWQPNQLGPAHSMRYMNHLHTVRLISKGIFHKQLVSVNLYSNPNFIHTMDTDARLSDLVAEHWALFSEGGGG
jgi:hypothetical protein